MRPRHRIDVVLLGLSRIPVSGEMRWVSGAGGVREKPVEDGERSISLVEATQRALQLQDSNPHYIVKGIARSGAELGGRTKSRSLPLPRFLLLASSSGAAILLLTSSSSFPLRTSPCGGL
ncbi:hypothetical protein Syun_014979 [Stephania yunnanensis]|uniref:Uncharacterized protein n=1 Tax=Stephania yunnanensis TaxID=152371 RepID=A0AAP0JKU5_9MAGN